MMFLPSEALLSSLHAAARTLASSPSPAARHTPDPYPAAIAASSSAMCRMDVIRIFDPGTSAQLTATSTRGTDSWDAR